MSNYRFAAPTNYDVTILSGPYEILENRYSGWLSTPRLKYSASELTEHEWMAERLNHAVRLMTDAVEINLQVRSGVPVLRDTRMPLSRILAEIGRAAFIDEFSERWDLDSAKVRAFFDGLSITLDRPFTR